MVADSIQEFNVNNRELRTVKEATERSVRGTKLVPVVEENAVRLELPFYNIEKESLYFFIARRPKQRRFTLLIPVESTGLLAVNDTLIRLQPMLKGYGLMLTQDAVIMEENVALPLHTRILNMSQALAAIDGVRRLWKVEYETRRRNATESETAKSVGHSADNSSSR